MLPLPPHPRQSAPYALPLSPQPSARSKGRSRVGAMLRRPRHSALAWLSLEQEHGEPFTLVGEDVLQLEAEH